MGKNFDRREFLRTSFLGLGTFFVFSSPLNLFGKTSSSPSTDISNSNIDANLLNKQAKELFYKKKYSEATTIYQQLIATYPNRISFYDGYARVLGAQQKTLEVAELYRKGLQANPKAPLFMHRLSLRMIDLATGNKKAEKSFINKYGESNLFETASQLLLQAIALKKSNKGLYLNLRDVSNTIDKRNKQLSSEDKQPIAISDNINSAIISATAAYEGKWSISRQSRKALITENNIDSDIDKISKRTRRELYNTKEKDEREKTLRKTKKERLKFGLEKNLVKDNPLKVEKYGTLILDENIYDTDTIGKLRGFYKKYKHYNRLIALNRYLYSKDSSLANSLALANVLCLYGNNSSDLSEAQQLLNTITPYITTMPTVCIGGFYIALAQIYKANNQSDLARTKLLEGLDLFDGKGGISYSLLEKYAHSFGAKKDGIGIEMLKAICGKQYKISDDLGWKYVKLHIKWRTEKKENNPIESAEQLKPLYALAKLQNIAGGSDYAITKSEIESLRAKLYK